MELIDESDLTTMTEVRSDPYRASATASARRPAAGQASGAHPGERRIPRDVKMPRKMRLDLSLVVRIENVIERQVALIEPCESFPDRDDLRIVGDCAE